MRTAIVALLLLMSCAPLRGFVADMYRVETWRRPSPPERARVEGIESVCTAGSINWIVPVDGGVVLIDAGFQESGEILKKAIGARRVLAILLTHAHIDHRAAAHQFAAPVYLGRGDVPLLENRYVYRDFATTLGAAIGVPPRPRTIIPVDDGFTLAVGGRIFSAVALPGHTPGSTAWLVDDLLFTGDAAQSPHGDAIYPAPAEVTEDMRRAYDSLRKLRDIPFKTMLDAHYGRLDDAKRYLSKALARAANDSTLYEHPQIRPAGCYEGDGPHIVTAPRPIAKAASTPKSGHAGPGR